jgi:hypothetical protein
VKDTKLGREVALKILPASFTNDPGTRRPVPSRSPGARLAQPSAHRADLTASKKQTACSSLSSSWSTTRLEANGSGPSAERLLAVTATGEPLMEREGGRSSVPAGVDLDKLLLQQDRSVVLIHNHPSNTGLSVADIEHLARPGASTIVAVGHDASVFAGAWPSNGSRLSGKAAVRAGFS